MIKFLLKSPYLSLFVAVFTVSFGFWLLVWSLGFNSLSLQSEDVVPTSILPVAVLMDHDLRLDSYYAFIIKKYPHPDDKNYNKGLVPYYLREVTQDSNNHYLTAFTIIPSLVALPFYLPYLLGLSVTWSSLAVVSHFASAMVICFSTILIYHILLKHLFLSKKKSYLLSLVFAFCTNNLSMFSQALWQHGIVAFFSLLALLFIFKNGDSFAIKNIFLAGVFMSLAFLTRPTALLIIFYLGLLLLSQARNYAIVFNNGLLYIMGLLIPLAGFLYVNSIYYTSLSNQGYASQLGSWFSKFPEGFIGMWLSPSKGILIYSPVFIFSLVGAYIVFKVYNWKSRDAFHYFIFTLIIIAHTLILSIWKHWYGGYSYGYRMAGEVIPFLVFMLVPYVRSASFEKTKKLFYFVAVISFGIHLGGIVFFDGIWHAAYDKGYVKTDWLWSIRDSEFAFNIRRILVKLGLMERACPTCLPNNI